MARKHTKYGDNTMVEQMVEQAKITTVANIATILGTTPAHTYDLIANEVLRGTLYFGGGIVQVDKKKLKEYVKAGGKTIPHTKYVKFI